LRGSLPCYPKEAGDVNEVMEKGTRTNRGENCTKIRFRLGVIGPSLGRLPSQKEKGTGGGSSCLRIKRKHSPRSGNKSNPAASRRRKASQDFGDQKNQDNSPNKTDGRVRILPRPSGAKIPFKSQSPIVKIKSTTLGSLVRLRNEEERS